MTHQESKLEIATEPQRSHYHMLSNCCEVVEENTKGPRDVQASDFVFGKAIKIALILFLLHLQTNRIKKMAPKLLLFF